MTPPLLTISAAFLSLVSVAAQFDPQAEGPYLPAATEYTFTVSTIDGRSVSGRVPKFDLSTGLVLISGPDHATATVPITDVIGLDRIDDAVGEPQPADMLQLTGGDRITGNIAGAAEEIIVIENSLFDQPIKIALTDVSAIVTAGGSRPGRRQLLEPFLASRGDRDDRLLLANGDVVRGMIVAVEGDAIEIEVDAAPLQVDLNHVLAATLIASSQTDPPDRQELQAQMSLDDGTRITVSELIWTPENGPEFSYRVERLRCPGNHIVRVELVGGRWHWLTSLEPLRYEHTPMMSVRWDYRIDRSVVNTPLRVANESFDRGIGTHSRSRLVYDLGGRFTEFVTRFGMDRTAGPLASVKAIVLVDGRTCLEEWVTSRSGLSGPARIRVAGAGTLELLVDFGENGSIHDRFNWIEPGLVE